ncbi:MAG TPA: transglycosylase domain-containing protein [Ktedonobacteraceae bacterium]|nr:transglycosylase domain-containing protein [Ktedonobacteraceae bacterium]
METPEQPRVPAKLPEHSRAAAAQRLDEKPQFLARRGTYYEVAHTPLHEQGWYIRRHMKRKNLHRSNLHYAKVDRAGTRWSLMPLAVSTLALIFITGSFFVIYTAFATAVNERYQGDIVTLASLLPKDSLRMYDEHGTLIYEAVDQGLQTSEELNSISPNLIHAEIAIEDQSFWVNPGYDITGIVRAALSDLSSKHVVAGGSTITQQLIKNVVVGNQDTAIRKLEEVILAPQATRYYTKQQIMDMYLNTTYYGNQAYGAEAAAFVYFGLVDTPKATAAQQLDLAQSAMLAGIPQNPTQYDPFLFPHTTFARMQAVLNQLQVQHYITLSQAQAAIAEAQGPHFLRPGSINNTLAPHFEAYTLNELATMLNVKESDLSRSGLVVSTTLDLPLQNQILKIAQQNVKALAKTNNLTDAAEVLIDFHTGAIRVLLGNIDPNNRSYGQFDVATQGYRQPGSAFKPFVYATAFKSGFSPGMPILDERTSFPLCCGLAPYTPANYDLGYHGLISARAALQNSFNIPAVKLLYRTGVDASLHTAQAMGITTYTGTPNYTMVLGTLGVHLLDITSAYGAFADSGTAVPAHAIASITGLQGQTTYQVPTTGKRAISPQVAYLMTSVLSDNQARTFEFGACSMLYLYRNTQAQCYAGHPGTVYPSAVKTGTSQNFADNWTIGYTNDFVMGVWAGNNDNSPMHNVIGVTGAGPIWHEGMLLAEQNRQPKDFAVPAGVVNRTVHYPAGLTSTDWYIKGLSWDDWGLGWQGSL